MQDKIGPRVDLVCMLVSAEVGLEGAVGILESPVVVGLLFGVETVPELVVGGVGLFQQAQQG